MHYYTKSYYSLFCSFDKTVSLILHKVAFQSMFGPEQLSANFFPNRSSWDELKLHCMLDIMHNDNLQIKFASWIF